MDHVRGQSVARGKFHSSLEGKLFGELAPLIRPLLVRVGPLLDGLGGRGGFPVTLLAVKCEAPRLHKLKALAADDPAVEAGVERQRQSSVLREAQHGIFGKVSAAVFIFALNVFCNERPLVGQILLYFRKVVILSLARICFKVLLFILT